MQSNLVISEKFLKKITIILIVLSICLCSLWVFLIVSDCPYRLLWLFIKPIGWIIFLILLLTVNLTVNTLLLNYLLKIKFWKMGLMVLSLSIIAIPITYMVLGTFANVSTSRISLITPLEVVGLTILFPIPLAILLGTLNSAFIKLILPLLSWKRVFLAGYFISFISCLCIFSLLEYKLLTANKRLNDNLYNPPILARIAKEDWFLNNRQIAIQQMIKEMDTNEAIPVLRELLKDNNPGIRHYAEEALKKIANKQNTCRLPLP